LQLIKALEAARGNGTSMISLILPPKDQVLPFAGKQLQHGLLVSQRITYSFHQAPQQGSLEYRTAS
jgi:hypothetical protein